MYFVNTLINKKSEKIQSQLSDLTTLAQESYSGIRVIKAYGQEKANLNFFDNHAEAYRKSGLALSTMEAFYFPAIGLLIGLSTLITIYIGSVYQLEHKISAGTIAEFVIYINMLTFPVSAIGWVASNIQRAAASQKRLNEFLHTKPSLIISPNPIPCNGIDQLKFDKVNFTYPHTGIHAIRDFSLDVKRGEKIAILGKTGCGKSTIAQLCLRMFDPTDGTVSINEINLRDMELESLRSQISYVPQDVFLFSDTIANNISFGIDNPDLELVTQAAKDADVYQNILDFPKGFDTLLGERGITLSGGQKQRVSIARAIAKEPKILILDDCLSAVDTKTENAILNSLKKIMENRTSIIISHRVSSAKLADQIIVLDEGRIVERGDHASLMFQKGVYAALFEKQTQGGESVEENVG
jgi:ATP-binding cassette subfamily B protein